jgi:hypothetical protein
MTRKMVTVSLLLLVAGAKAEDRAVDALQAVDHEQDWNCQADPNAPAFRRSVCKCKCYRCLRVGTLMVTSSANIPSLDVTDLTVVNQTITGTTDMIGDVSFSGNVTVGGNLGVNGAINGTTASLSGALNVGGDIVGAGNVNLGAGAVLTQAFLNQLIALSSFGNFTNPSAAIGAIASGAPVQIPTAGSASVGNPVVVSGVGQFNAPAAGNYNVNFAYQGDQATGQLTLYVNGVAQPGAVFNADVNNVISGNVVIPTSSANSTIELRNTTPGALALTPVFTSFNPYLNIQRVS